MRRTSRLGTLAEERSKNRLRRDRCLGGDALVAVALERGWISEAKALEGEGTPVAK